MAGIWLEMYQDPFVDSDEVFRLFYKFTSLMQGYYSNFSSKLFDKYFTKGIKKLDKQEKHLKQVKKELREWKKKRN